ncbi:MAG: flagellar export chaperone FlgN [Phycisphaerales bacterium]
MNQTTQTQMAVLSPEQTLRELDRLVTNLESQYRAMLEAVEAHERAMRVADSATMATCVARENDAVQAIAELDKRRAHIVSLYKKSNGVTAPRDGAEPLTITAIARRIGGESGGRLAARAEALRELIAAVRRKTDALHMAAKLLGAHMDGLMRQVMQMLNHAQVYSRGGSVSSGPAVTTALDITS